MLHYKTQAIKRLEAFFEANYQKMYGIAVKEVGEHRAWDAVNDTYISLIEKEERGRGHYDESYGSRYGSYVYGALYGTLKGMRKASVEITETALKGINEDGEDAPSYLETVGTYDNIDAVIQSMVSCMDVCSDLITVCGQSNTDVVALVRAIKQPEGLSSSFISKFFASLRKAAKSDISIITTIEDFIHLYGEKPAEVNSCLVQLGVCI